MYVRILLAVLALTAAVTGSLAAALKETVLIAFSKSTSDAPNLGYNPQLGVLVDSSDRIYGSTINGGVNGGGVIYRKTGEIDTVLYSFTTNDKTGCGYTPSAALVMGPGGALYGSTFYGGVGGGGVIFQLQASQGVWTCKPIYSFSDKGSLKVRGFHSFGGVLLAADGSLYGVAQNGGVDNGGVVFHLQAPGGGGGMPWTYTVLHQFAKQREIAGSCNGGTTCKPTDGYTPAGGLVMDAGGVIYGKAFFGGVQNGGVIFKLTPTGSDSPYTVIHKFTGQPTTGTPSPGGYQPADGPLYIDAGGIIYGEAVLGGTIGGGVAFKMARNMPYQYTVLHNFDSTTDSIHGGYNPFGGFTAKSGKLYGVTKRGGSSDVGTVFALSKKADATKGTGYAKVFDFSSSQTSIGSTPNGRLSLKSNGDFVGTTFTGGKSGGGVLFLLTP